MRTADRIIQQGIKPLHPSDNDENITFVDHSWEDGDGVVGSDWRKYNASIAEWVGEVPILVADNVADYVSARGDHEIDDYPCLAPPWPAFFIEYHSFSGRERRGVLVQDATDIPRHPTGVYQGAMDDAEKQTPGVPVKWLIELTVLVEARGEVRGPLGWMVLALDARGKMIGNRWSINSTGGAQVLDGITGADSHTVIDWLASSTMTALQTIAFLHCKNVVTDVHHPPRALSRKRVRRTGKPLVSYRTVRLVVPRRATPGGGATGKGEEVSYHIVPGHMAHYGDCCPGGHEPHGKLFGRLEGVYWVETHAAGNPTHGVSVRDYELEVRDP